MNDKPQPKMSPARAHYLRTQAAQRAAREGGAAATRKDATGYEMMMAKLAEDRRRLKQVQSIEGKAELKRKLLPDYQAWVDGALTNATGVQDAVLMTVMVWLLDIGDFAPALRIAGYALEHDLVMPDQYNRDTATVIGEELADQTLKALAVDGAEQDPAILAEAIDLLEAHDMPDQVRAKLHKALGYVLRSNEDLEQRKKALASLQRAFQLNEKSGVKKDIEVLAREIERAEKEQAQQQRPA